MKTADFLRQHDACSSGSRWALSVSKDMSAVWEAMIEQGKYEWLLWTATRPGLFPDSVLRKLACRFVRETPIANGRMVWDLLTDERSRKAVEVAERYADGNATEKELADAYDSAYADAAFYAAADAAWAAAWAAATAAAYFAANVAGSSYAVAYAAQIRKIAELSNPFKQEAGL